jgi:hypothetical protein
MERPIPMQVKTWFEVRRDLESGAKGYYVERDGFYTICVLETNSQCEMPTKHTLETMVDVASLFEPGPTEEFERLWQHKLLRSEKLSDPVA